MTSTHLIGHPHPRIGSELGHVFKHEILEFPTVSLPIWSLIAEDFPYPIQLGYDSMDNGRCDRKTDKKLKRRNGGD